MKIKTLFFISANFIAVSAFAFPQYNSLQLQQFYKTHECENCNLTRSYISGDYSGADLMGTNLNKSVQYSSIFSNGNFKNSTMKWIHSFDTNYTESDFSNAQMNASIFIRANFSNANFTGAIVADSDFDSANFLGSNITQQQLASAGSICNAILPDGSKGKCKN